MPRKILINYDLLALILLASETKMLPSTNTVGSTDCAAPSQRIFVFSQVASVIFSASYPDHICKFQIAIFWRV